MLFSHLSLNLINQKIKISSGIQWSACVIFIIVAHPETPTVWLRIIA